MPFGSVMLTDKMDDNSIDDLPQAIAQIKANADLYNAFRLLIKAAGGLDIGDGLKDDLSGNLALALASDAGLETVTNLLKVKLQADSALERVAAGLRVNIGGLTEDTTPDLVNDFLMTRDATDGKPKKVKLDKVGGVGANSITQTEMAASAIGQGEMKTTTGDMTVVNGETNPPQLVTGPGGEYGFWPTMKNANANAGRFIVMPIGVLSSKDVGGGDVVLHNQKALTTSFLQKFWIANHTVQTGAPGTLTVRQRYIQASPPYDLGDGAVAGFIFALIDNATGEPIAMYQAPEPPWALNGPTDIGPDFIDKNGKKFKLVEQGREKMSAIIGNAAKEAALFNAPRNRVKGKKIQIEITNAMKNADMGLIGHPFIGNDMTGKTVVMLDPMSGFMERMMDFQQDGDSPLSEIFHKGFARIDNVKLPRKGPLGVDIVAAKLK